jgi:uroporphyrinogen decarboxylase
MNSKQRVQTTFAHQVPDRVPIFEYSIDNPTAEAVLGRPNLCGFGGQARGVAHNEALLAGRVEAYHAQRLADEIELWLALDLDILPNAFPVPKNPLIPEQIDATHWRFEDPTTGHWTLYQYNQESDVYDEVDSTLRQEGLPALEELTTTLEASEPNPDDWDFTPVETLVRDCGQDRFIMGHADVEIGSTFCWAEHFLMGLLLEPDLSHRYLDARLKHALVLTEEVLKHGVDGIHGGYDWASNKGPLFSPRHFEEFVFPRLKQITDLCHRYGVPYVKHTDGNINSLIPGIIAAGVDGLHAIEPGAGMDIAQIKQDYGDRLTLLGNVDCAGVLVHGPAEAVRAETESVIHAAGMGGGFILSSSNSIHPGVPPDHYLAMRETARQVGNYPLKQ